MRGAGAPPEAFSAPAAGPEVRRVRVDHSAATLEEGLRLLGDAEQERAARFRHAADRARYIAGRATLRRLLSVRLGVANEELVFGANAFGKPMLLEPQACLQFNSSHSGEWVLHAFHPRAQVGIDVERVRPDLANVGEFASALSPEEASWISSLPQGDRPVALARTWVRKEAYVKAIGEGVARSPVHIRIEVDAAGRPRLSYDRNTPRARDHWLFQDIPLDPDHVACVVWRSERDEIAIESAAVIRDFGL
jgi:4'-phosphopantetheinyl transferase